MKGFGKEIKNENSSFLGEETTMKKVLSAIAALAILGFAWTVSAEPTYSDSERTFWENQALHGQ